MCLINISLVTLLFLNISALSLFNGFNISMNRQTIELVVKKNEQSKIFCVIILSGFALIYISDVDSKSRSKFIVKRIALLNVVSIS